MTKPKGGREKLRVSQNQTKNEAKFLKKKKKVNPVTNLTFSIRHVNVKIIFKNFFIIFFFFQSVAQSHKRDTGQSNTCIIIFGQVAVYGHLRLIHTLQ